MLHSLSMPSRKSLIFSCSLGNFVFSSLALDRICVILVYRHMPIANDNCKHAKLLHIYNVCNSITSSGPLVFNAIRAIHPLTPILIFGGKNWSMLWIRSMVSCGYIGHTHIRDCRKSSLLYLLNIDWRTWWAQSLLVQLDGRSMSLGSGRYMETIGEKCQCYFCSSSHWLVF